MVATAIIGSALIGGVSTAIGAQSAASAQKSAANQATKAQMEMFNKTQANLQPFVNLGTGAAGNLASLSSEFANNPITLSQDWLEQTPGYKFNLAQGLKSTENALAARGLGSSGAALKGAAAYATGLADSTYQNQFTNALVNRQFQLQAAESPVTIGENAAAGLGKIATTTGSNIGSNIIGAGNAQAGANIATGNAVAGASNSLVSALLAKQMFGGGAGAATGVYNPAVGPSGYYNYWGQ